jgi:hypothetical protein
MKKKEVSKMSKTVQLGLRIPHNIYEKYTEFCDGVGGRYQDELCGAMLVWQYLPGEIRDRAKRQSLGTMPFDKAFWEAYRDAFERGLTEHVLGQSPAPEKPAKLAKKK